MVSTTSARHLIRPCLCYLKKNFKILLRIIAFDTQLIRIIASVSKKKEGVIYLLTSVRIVRVRTRSFCNGQSDRFLIFLSDTIRCWRYKSNLNETVPACSRNFLSTFMFRSFDYKLPSKYFHLYSFLNYK